MFKLFLAATSATVALLTSMPSMAEDAKSAGQWFEDGQKAVQERLAQQPNIKRAKNVILFVGDGMGISTLTAGRILEGQLRGETGEENYLSFETFPNTALVKTYNTDAQVPDSAGTATALNTGVKTNIGVVNTGPEQPSNTCQGTTENLLTPIAHLAEQAGMATGIVSTARLTHATPAAVYAHSPSRQWESDKDLPNEAQENGCRDIAQQILGNIGGNGLEVALGGGRSNFLPASLDGRRKDDRNLTQEWLSNWNNAAYVSNAAELEQIDYDTTGHLLGLFSNSHMSYEAQRGVDEPDLAAMTEAAIKVLEKSDGGYYLMVEAGRIDHGHHDGRAYSALHDTVALSKAVRQAVQMVDTEETLILVTADHSHVFTMAGYPKRGNPIFGVVVPPHSEEPTKADDGKPYTTLGYHNGPGAVNGERAALTMEATTHPEYRQQAVVPKGSETHGGEDVALFGIGPWAHLVRGTMEQNVIFHIMHHALGLADRQSD